MTHGQMAKKERERKEDHPEEFCKQSSCLWRIKTREGFRQCPKHPEYNVPPKEEVK